MQNLDDILDAIEDEMDFSGSGLSQKRSAIKMRRWRESDPERARLRWLIDRNNQRARRMGCEGMIRVEEWILLCAKYGGHCLKCGEITEVQIDHVVPLEKGGANVIENIQPLCATCNKMKFTSMADYRFLTEQNLRGGQKVIRQILLRIIKHRVIQGECAGERGPLLIRYYIANNRFFGIYFHHLLRSDIERHLHDHPWPFMSIILRGRYVEHTPQGKLEHKTGSILFRPAMWLHALELENPAWSLVITGRTCREWGFLVDKAWVKWRDYDYAEKERCA